MSIDNKTEFFKLTPRIATRLTREVFLGPGVEIYKNEGFLDTEERFGKIRTAIGNLAMNDHLESDVRLGKMIEDLLKTGDFRVSRGDYSPQRAATISEAGKKLRSTAKEYFGKIKANDVLTFARLGQAGREHYRAAGYDPNEFLPLATYTLAVMIADNFQAYELTLNNDYMNS